MGCQYTTFGNGCTMSLYKLYNVSHLLKSIQDKIFSQIFLRLTIVQKSQKQSYIPALLLLALIVNKHTKVLTQTKSKYQFLC